MYELFILLFICVIYVICRQMDSIDCDQGFYLSSIAWRSGGRPDQSSSC